MKFNTLLSILSFASASSLENLSSCGSSSDILQLETINITPYPVIAGQPITVTVAGKISQDITAGAKAIVGIKWGIAHYSDTIDICEQVPGGCPLLHTNGTQQLDIHHSIPKMAPAIKVNLKVDVVNGDNSKIACLQGKIQIVKK